MSRASVQNLVWAFLVGLFVGAGPFVPGGIGMSILAGSAAGAAVIGYGALNRHKYVGPAAPALPETSRAATIVLGTACGLLIVGVFAPTGKWLFHRWTSSIWQNGHSLYVPLVMAYLARSTLRRDPSPAVESSPWGFAFIVPAFALVLVDTVLQSFYLATIGLILLFPGLSLLAFGARRTRMLALPLCLGIFMIPISDVGQTQLYLRNATVSGVEPLLRLAGFAVLREGTYLQLPSFAVNVADACSGFSALYASLFVAVTLAGFVHSTGRRILMLLAVWPVALVSNIARAFILVVLIDRFGGEILDTSVHGASGVVTYCTSLALLFLIAGRRTLGEILR